MKRAFFRRLGLETGLSSWYAGATIHTTCRETAPCPWESSYQMPGTAFKGNFCLSWPRRPARRGRRTAGSSPCRTWRRWSGASVTATAASGTLPQRAGAGLRGQGGVGPPDHGRPDRPAQARPDAAPPVRPVAGCRRSPASRRSHGPSRGSPRPGFPSGCTRLWSGPRTRDRSSGTCRGIPRRSPDGSGRRRSRSGSPAGRAPSAAARPAALAGVAPFARDSGTLRGGRRITGGRRRPRDVLYMAAMAACMSDPDTKEMHGRPGPRGQGPQGRGDRGHAEARRHRERPSPRPAHLGGQVGGRRLTPVRARRKPAVRPRPCGRAASACPDGRRKRPDPGLTPNMDAPCVWRGLHRPGSPATPLGEGTAAARASPSLAGVALRSGSGV